MKRTQNQNKRLHKLITELQISSDNKASMVLAFTKNRTEHTSEMYYAEAQRMIERLEEMQSKPQNKQKNELAQKFRRTIFRLMYDIGFINSDMSTPAKIREIHAFMNRKTNFQKHFNALTIDELTTLEKQLQAIKRRYDEKESRNAQMN